jgi:hypothetical protein
MNGEQVKIWQETSRPVLRYSPGICLEILGKTTKYLRIAGNPVEI